MPNQLRITLIQMDIRWEDATTNHLQLDQSLTGLAGQTDLVVLPEMFTTGFSMHPKSIAETAEGPTLAWLRQKAKQLDAAIVGSIVFEEAGQYFNRLLFVQPDGQIQQYDKRHCFTLAGEHHHYQAGQSRTIIEWRGWRICPLICYDLRFPVWSRQQAPYYDLLLYVANWPEKRSYHWRQLLLARAIENQVYTAGVNRVGTDANGHVYRGDSAVVRYDGQVLWQAAYVSTQSTLVLDKAAQANYRSKLAFLPDADAFELSTGML